MAFCKAAVTSTLDQGIIFCYYFLFDGIQSFVAVVIVAK